MYLDFKLENWRSSRESDDGRNLMERMVPEASCREVKERSILVAS